MRARDEVMRVAPLLGTVVAGVVSAAESVASVMFVSNRAFTLFETRSENLREGLAEADLVAVVKVPLADDLDVTTVPLALVVGVTTVDSVVTGAAEAKVVRLVLTAELEAPEEAADETVLTAEVSVTEAEEVVVTATPVPSYLN